MSHNVIICIGRTVPLFYCGLWSAVQM